MASDGLGVGSCGSSFSSSSCAPLPPSTIAHHGACASAQVRTTASVDYGSAIHGLRFRVAVKSLLSIDMAAHLDKNWKPQLLLLYTLQVQSPCSLPLTHIPLMLEAAALFPAGGRPDCRSAHDGAHDGARGRLSRRRFGQVA